MPIAGAITFASRTSSRNSPVRFVGTAAPTSGRLRENNTKRHLVKAGHTSHASSQRRVELP